MFLIFFLNFFYSNSVLAVSSSLPKSTQLNYRVIFHQLHELKCWLLERHEQVILTENMASNPQLSQLEAVMENIRQYAPKVGKWHKGQLSQQNNNRLLTVLTYVLQRPYLEQTLWLHSVYYELDKMRSSLIEAKPQSTLSDVLGNIEVFEITSKPIVPITLSEKKLDGSLLRLIRALEIKPKLSLSQINNKTGLTLTNHYIRVDITVDDVKFVKRLYKKAEGLGADNMTAFKDHLYIHLPIKNLKKLSGFEEVWMITLIDKLIILD
jgi:hypothetical protein